MNTEVKAMNTPGLYPPMPSATRPRPSSDATAHTAMRVMLRCAIPVAAVSVALTPPTRASTGSARGACATTG